MQVSKSPTYIQTSTQQMLYQTKVPVNPIAIYRLIQVQTQDYVLNRLPHHDHTTGTELEPDLNGNISRRICDCNLLFEAQKYDKQ